MILDIYMTFQLIAYNLWIIVNVFMLSFRKNILAWYW
jgi:hypothetical protein